jgi:hypothetical protein
MSDILSALRATAHSYPEVSESLVCGRQSFKARKKSFLFVGERLAGCDAMVKLRDSLSQAKALARQMPDSVTVGANGWVTVVFQGRNHPPLNQVKKWIDESFRLNAPKSLLAVSQEARDGTQPSLKSKKTALTS